jgi:uncharacterized OB-fold protein
VNVFVCSNGHAVFPQRLLCPVCGSGEWRVEPAGAGTVELVTELASWARIADVRLDSGPVVVALACPEVSVGARVSLEADERRAITARPDRV